MKKLKEKILMFLFGTTDWCEINHTWYSYGPQEDWYCPKCKTLHKKKISDEELGVF
jgi:hypothetical protein